MYENIKSNVFSIRTNISLMCGCFWIGFTDFMLAGKTLIDYTSFFSPYDFEKIDNIILNYFENEWMKF